MGNCNRVTVRVRVRVRARKLGLGAGAAPSMHRELWTATPVLMRCIWKPPEV